MNGIVTFSGVQQTNYTRSTAEGRVLPTGDVALHGADEVSFQTAQPFQEAFVVQGNPVVVAREMGNVPAAHAEAGGVAQYLSGVPDERFYNVNGQPNYNGIFADLARKSFATFPDSLEDGRLPNLSTFQRAVATEARKREQTPETFLYLAMPGANLVGAVASEIERSTERDVRSYTGVAVEQSPVQGAFAFDGNSGAFVSTQESSSSVTPYTVTAEVVSHPERAVAGLFPSVTEQAGGLAAFLRTVPQEHFYNDEGNPSYNKIFGALARFNNVSGPEALEDGTLPNITTFQRSVAKERSRRESEAAAQMAGFLVGTGFAGPQGNRVLEQAAKMAGLG